MATIRKLEHTQGKSGARKHTEVDATISIVESNGEMFIQIDTFGSVHRDFPGKLSQTIRLSKNAVQEIADMGKLL